MVTKCDCVCIPREEYEKLNGQKKATKPKSTKKKKVSKPKSKTLEEPVVIPKVIAAPKAKTKTTKTTKAKPTKKEKPKTKTAKTRTTTIKTTKPKTSKTKAKKNSTVKYAVPQIKAPRETRYNGQQLERRIKESSSLRLSAPKVDLSGLKGKKAVTTLREDLRRLRSRPKIERVQTPALPSPRERNIYLERRSKELPGRRDEPLALPAPTDDAFESAKRIENCENLSYFKRKACERRNRKRVS